MAQKPGVQRDYKGSLQGCKYSFAGINNIIDPSNLDIDKGEVADGVNVDFDNTNSISRRKGFVSILAGDYHSSWNNENKTLSYLVSDSVIYEWDGAGAPYPIIFLSNNSKVEFCQVNDVIVYSNGVDFGVIGGTNSQRTTYSPDFKTATTGGRNLEFYNGRLYFSKQNTLYCTDTFDVEHVDVRFNEVATFPHNITMCKRVEDGLWVGTEKILYFLKGDDIRTDGFEQLLVARAGVVYGTAIKTNAEYVPESGNTFNVVLFLTTQGVVSGGNSGKYTNHSFNTVSIDAGKTGTALLRIEKGISQYVVCFEKDAGEEYNTYQHGIDIEVNLV